MHTNGGNLPAKHVIHTVGPIWHGGHNDEAGLLAKAYRNSLELAARLGVQTIAFPNISTGIYSYPKEEAAEIAFNEILRFRDQDNSIKKVIFCCFDEENFDIYQETIKSLEDNTLDKF